MEYGVFLMAMLLRDTMVGYQNMDSLKLFVEAERLYKLFDESNYNNARIGLYECIENFLDAAGFDKVEPQVWYYLFGQDATSEYVSSGDLDKVSEEAFSVKKFEGCVSPYEVLEWVDGWGDFTEITEEEYNKLNSKY